MNLFSATVFPAPFKEFLSDLNQLGVNLSVKGTPYVVAGARSNSRWWLFPVGNGPACLRAGLEMYQPVSKSGRLAKLALRFATYTVPSKIFGVRSINFLGQPDFAGLFGRPDLCFAYFTGTDGPHRKTAVQIMAPDGAILGYAKISQKEHVKRYIANEARMLSIISKLNIQTCETPRLLELRNSSPACCLITDTQRTASCRTLVDVDAKHIALLRELAGKTGKNGGRQLVNELREFCEDSIDWLPEEWRHRFEIGLVLLEGKVEQMPVCLAHGDFTPWNCFVLADRLYVFDWEYARTIAPVGSDLVRFVLSTSQGQPAQSVMERLRHMVAQTLCESDLPDADNAILLSLMMQALFYMNRLRESELEATAWQEAPFQAAYIDCLIAQMESKMHSSE